MTAVTEDIDSAFAQALAGDAGLTEAPVDFPPPPRIDRDPAAPHGRAPDGSAMAPHGLKADGTPRLKAAGPGRPKADDKPRVTASAPGSGTPSPGKAGGSAVKDYTADLMELGSAVWLAGSAMKGGKLGPVPIPDTRPYAAVWRMQLPQMAAAWNTAAQQDPTIRGYVEKFTGEGSKTWIIGVGIAMVGLVASCTEMAKAPAEVKANATAVNDANLQAYIKQQVDEMGLAA